MIRFLLGNRQTTVSDAEADTTVLEFLRGECSRSGTKEGCASGDCGACTVVVGSLAGSAIHYEPLNSCIAPLGSLHGKQLISVEDLRDGQALHPVQAAMVSFHGSQCGFCTPGFVMSLFALYKRQGNEEPTRDEILEALGGNLCRCTGYRPIIDAAASALQVQDTDQFTRRTDETVAALEALQEHTTPTAQQGAYLRPESARELAQLLAQHPDARIVAGATDLFLEVTQGLRRLPKLIDIRAATDLRALIRDEHGLHIGAGVTHHDAAALVLQEYPELAEIIERFGSLQIRSHGTIAGNVANASPVGDWPPVLLALNATLQLQSEAGIRTLPIDEFFLGYRKTALAPGEFVSGITLPRRPHNLLLRAYKISKRYEDDISSVCGVFALALTAGLIESARVAFGGMAAVPARAPGCESALPGRDLDDDTLDSAARALDEDFTPITDARASAGYRQRVAKNLLRRLALEVRGVEPTRVYPADYIGEPSSGAAGQV